MSTEASTETVIELDGLTRDFKGPDKTRVRALDTVTASIPGGCMVGLVGPDGAGKTTLMRLLAGLLLPTKGDVRVLGKVPGNNADVGYMPQRFGLYEDLSVHDNLSLHAELRGLVGAARQATFARLLDFTSLAPFTARLAGNLSGGMKQKLGLACALLTTPRLLLLDEPGVGVDPLSRRELWGMVQALCVGGISVIWSTAYMDEAERCAHVLMLDAGKPVYAGPPSAFIDRVRGRVFLLHPPAGTTRQVLADWSSRGGVRDALIQGSHVRVVLSTAPELSMASSIDPVTNALEMTLTEPRLEDAYMDTVVPEQALTFPFAGLSHPVADKTNRLPVIVADGLTKRFGAFTAAEDISFSVRPGEIFGLLGPNGAGKSTTFRMLCGLSKPTAGQCTVAGLDMRTAGGVARAKLGYMAQKFSLYPELTVYRNMELIAELYGLDSPRERVRQRLHAFGLDPVVRVRSGDLPLGHKQRLALAAATLHDPPALFLDEPTSGVDPRSRREFWRHINAMTDAGTAVLVTTHFMEEAEYCDTIALVYHGRVIALGTPDALKSGISIPQIAGITADPTLEDAFIARILENETDRASRAVGNGADAATFHQPYPRT